MDRIVGRCEHGGAVAEHMGDRLILVDLDARGIEHVPVFTVIEV